MTPKTVLQPTHAHTACTPSLPPHEFTYTTNLLALTSSKIDFFLYGVPTVSSKKQDNETGTEWKPNTGSKPTLWNSMSLEFHFH